jgi:hypothetical protein
MADNWKYGVIVSSFGSFPGPCVLLLREAHDFVEGNPRWLFPADDPSTDSALSYGYNALTAEEIRENWIASLERIVLNSNPDAYWRTSLEKAERMNIKLIKPGQGKDKKPRTAVKPPVRKAAPQPSADKTRPETTLASAAQTNESAVEGAFAFEVSAVFTIKGKGLVAAGLVKSGSIVPGTIVEMETSSGMLKAQVVELAMFAKQLAKASAGEEVGLTLEGVDSPINTDQVKAGMIIRSGT